MQTKFNYQSDILFKPHLSAQGHKNTASLNLYSSARNSDLMYHDQGTYQANSYYDNAKFNSP